MRRWNNVLAVFWKLLLLLEEFLEDWFKKLEEDGNGQFFSMEWDEECESMGAPSTVPRMFLPMVGIWGSLSKILYFNHEFQMHVLTHLFNFLDSCCK